MQIVFSSLVGWLSATPEIVDGSLCVWVSSDKADKKMHLELLPKGLLLTEQLEWHPGWEYSTFCHWEVQRWLGWLSSENQPGKYSTETSLSVSTGCWCHMYCKLKVLLCVCRLANSAVWEANSCRLSALKNCFLSPAHNYSYLHFQTPRDFKGNCRKRLFLVWKEFSHFRRQFCYLFLVMLYPNACASGSLF